MSRSLGVAVIGLAVTGCTHAGARESFTTRDSAGVSIVESTRPAWPGGRGWRLSPRPRTEIGGRSDDPHYDLLQVTHAMRLADGRLVLANRGTNELRVYDSTGLFQRSIGRPGSGPGEFRGLYGLTRLHGDTLATYDFALRRLTVFTADGAIVAVLSQLVDGNIRARPIGRRPDGSWIAQSGGSYGMEARAGRHRDTIAILRLDSAVARVLDTIALLPGFETYVLRTGEGHNAVMSVSALPFGLGTSYVLAGEYLYVGDNARYAVDVYSVDGQLRRSVRRSLPRRPLTPEVIERARSRELALTEGREHAWVEQKWAEAPLPTMLPSFEAVRLDPDDDLWVSDYSTAPADSGAAAIFDATGRWLGSVPLPPGLHPVDIGRDYLVGVWRDENELEHLRLYGLEKRGAE